MAYKTTRKGPAPPAQPAPAPSPLASSPTPTSTHPAPTSVWGKSTNPLTSPAHAPSTTTAQPPASNGTTATVNKDKPKEKITTPPTTSSPTSSTSQPSPSPPSNPSPTPTHPIPTVSPSTLTSLTIGSFIRCTTVLSESIDGTVYCYDPSTSILALEVTKPNGHPDFAMINTTALTSLSVVRPSSSPARHLPEVDQGRLAGKEARAVGMRVEESRKIGVGVSGVGQRVFDALAKLYGAVWEGRVIVLMDGMKLNEPYTDDQLTGGTAQQRQRITKTIQQVLATNREGNSK